MAKYKAYPEYKDSGVEWLGVIPTEWKISHFKWLTNDGKAFASGPFGSSIGSKFYQECGIPVIRGNNLSINGEKPFFKDSGYVYLDDAKANELSNAEVIAGDLVFTARGTVGQVGLIPTDGTLSWNRAILSANQLRYRTDIRKYNSNYLWYQFSSWFIRTQITLSSDSVAQPNLNLGSLKTLNIIVPPLMVQKAIADFLDHETAKIDNLIEKQRQLIEILKEKRQAVISHAVTKGLNSDVPMKDSGVEWLGPISQHCIITKLKYLTVLKTEKIVSNNIRYVGLENISSGTGKLLSKDEMTPEGISVSFDCDDVLFGKLRPYLAKCWLATFSGICSSEFLVLQPKKMHARYLNYYLLTNEFIKQVDSSTYGSKMPRANWDFISQLPVPTWTYEESKTIAVYLDNLTAKLDCLLEKQNQQVNLLQERRTALISAAVTGKIDVRDWVAPDSQVVEEPQEATA